ncbi:MAG: hypothetical protein MJ156_01035 [Alphaproteobacteria bacterium]|nr:hypothetical protein [Alphaproteobacteria bacterium]
MLALTLVFAFMPFLSSRLSSRGVDAKMYAATEQIENLHTAARIYIREQKDSLQYEKKIVAGDEIADMLESYGLPMGFVPRTGFNQNITLTIDKKPEDMSVYITLDKGDLSNVQLTELSRRIGFYANFVDNEINITVPLDSVYSDIVTKKESYNNNTGFLSNLDMGNNNINKIGNIYARNGEFETAQFSSLVSTGLENGRKNKNKISDIYADKTIFQSVNGEAALSLVRGELNVNNLSARTISKYGNAGNLISDSAAVYDFSMAEDKTGFVGPFDWFVHGAVEASNINFSIERLDISSVLNASLGQDVYVNPYELEYSTNSGIETDTISVSNITLRDQTSYGLLNGKTGAVIVDIRPAGTSFLPDVYINSLNNDDFKIIDDYKDTTGKTVSCKEIIDSLNGVYNKNSLAQHIICEYVFWQRLENRINIKQCLLSGRNDCI